MNDHWIEDEKTRKRFWPWAKEHLTEDEIHAVLSVESVKEFDGTMAEAKVLIEQAVEAKITMEREEEEERLYRAAVTLPCTPMWVSTNFISPVGYEWRYCYDVGLPSDLRILALEQVRDAVRDFEAMAKAESWLVPGALNGAPARRLVAAPAPGAGISPPPATSAEPPPPVPTGPITSPIPQDEEFANRLILDTAFVKITAPTGKPRIEFWNPNRQYPEIYWALSAEAFLEQVASGLEAAGWTAEHFKQVGEQYTLALRIEWVVSPKNEKWKDIIAVWLRQ